MPRRFLSPRWLLSCFWSKAWQLSNSTWKRALTAQEGSSSLCGRTELSTKSQETRGCDSSRVFAAEAAPFCTHTAPQPGSVPVTSRLCDVPGSRWHLVALAKRGTLFLLSPALPSLQPTPGFPGCLGAVRWRAPSLGWGLMSPGLSDVSSASQALILVLLHFLAARQSNEQSNPFCNLFLLLYSLEEVMALEIASPGGRKGPDPNSPYTTASPWTSAASSSCPESSRSQIRV